MIKTREDVKRSLLSKMNLVKGICETLRLIYDEIDNLENKEKKNRVTELLIDAFIMAKKMDDRLGYYKTTYGDTTGHSGRNLEKMTGLGRRFILRRSRREIV